MKNSINISDINADFSEDNELKDDYFIDLLGQAMQGRILCQGVVVDLAEIQPYSDYQPQISVAYRKHFITKLENRNPPALYIYERSGKLIMSDDYNAYYMYRECGMRQCICILIGYTDKKDDIEYVGDPFELPPLTVEMI